MFELIVLRNIVQTIGNEQPFVTLYDLQTSGNEQPFVTLYDLQTSGNEQPFA